MDLANRYFMRASGEFQHQASGYAEKIAYQVVNVLKRVEYFRVGVESIIDEDKLELSGLNSFMENIRDCVDSKNDNYTDVRNILRVIKDTAVLNDLVVSANAEDAISLTTDILVEVELNKPQSEDVPPSTNNWVIKLFSLFGFKLSM
ncbi:hypothetical protein BM526_20390 (plasmid) [Alteromonas mediterranea]|uniref:hypothetical protein n=1 Tax=Alteromonas mediterranea TaxID=314275 RepID=UPI0009039C63|nr:hypothetical protein [Alteromonas mediterranea]APE04333.1 hypothetical protein BM526_20390 [Alteromonas mediterranea]